MSYHHIAELVHSCYGSEFLSAIGYPAYQGVRPSPWIRRMLYTKNRRISTIAILLIICVLFGSVQEFEVELNEGLQPEMLEAIEKNPSCLRVAEMICPPKDHIITSKVPPLHL